MDDFVEYLVIFILVLFGACLLLYFCNSELSARKDIIEKTNNSKNFAIIFFRLSTSVI